MNSVDDILASGGASAYRTFNLDDTAAHNIKGLFFYVPDLGVWERIHVAFRHGEPQSTLRDERAALADVLPEGGLPVAVDLGCNYVIREVSDRMTYFDFSGFYARHHSSRSSGTVYPLAPSFEDWVAGLRKDVQVPAGSRAGLLIHADRQRSGGTRPDEMWHFPDLRSVQCIARHIFLRFSPGQYQIEGPR